MTISPTLIIDRDAASDLKDYISGLNKIPYYLGITSGESINTGYVVEKTAKFPGLMLQFARSVFSFIDPLIDLDFVETSNPSQAKIKLYAVNSFAPAKDSKSDTVGYALSRPTNSDFVAFWLNTGEINNDMNTIVHEIGHALGIGHPGVGAMPSNENPKDPGYSTDDTVMSYNIGKIAWATQYTSSDVLALQQLWGIEKNIENGTLVSSSSKYDTRDFVSNVLETTSPAPVTTQITDDSSTNFNLDVLASTWSERVKITRIVKSSDAGEKLEGKQINYSAGEVAGSLITGGKGNDDIKGFAGWDILDGGEGNDLIHGGNGRDIITGGLGADQLWGDFGWNTYTSEKDSSSDLIAVKSDQYVVNWLYGKAGNNPNGEKADIIEGLDTIDRIVIVGVATSDLTFSESATSHGATGIGIYGRGALEALYVGGDLSLAQIKSMTSGDASAAAMANTINSYTSW